MLPRRCAKCRRVRLASKFKWHDKPSGRRGSSRRCLSCRRAKAKHGPLWLSEPRYRIRSHAVLRYIERVRPDLTFNAARLEMLELMQGAQLSRAAPPWHEHRPIHPAYRGYLRVSDEIVFCLRDYRHWSPTCPRVMVATVLVAPQLQDIAP
jgi:hypothetical protein